MSVHRRLCRQFCRRQCFLEALNKTHITFLYTKEAYTLGRGYVTRSWGLEFSMYLVHQRSKGFFMGWGLLLLPLICPMVYVVFPRKRKFQTWNLFSYSSVIIQSFFCLVFSWILAGTMTQLFEADESECSVIMLWTYAIAAFSLTIWSTIFMWIVA